jgi:hypothetical protein
MAAQLKKMKSKARKGLHFCVTFWALAAVSFSFRAASASAPGTVILALAGLALPHTSHSPLATSFSKVHTPHCQVPSVGSAEAPASP